jgi:hypothetical protein
VIFEEKNLKTVVEDKFLDLIGVGRRGEEKKKSQDG